MNCFYCGWRNGHHDPHCPQDRTPDWGEGYSDGRSRRPAKFDAPVYNLGYNRGIVALEEAENGFRPGIDGGQW